MRKLFKLQHLWFAALLTWCAQMTAQNPNFTYNNTLLDVTFVNTAFPTGIAKDDGSGFFTAPDWSSRAVNPVAYVSGTAVKIKARFQFSCTPTGTVYVKGVNPDGYDLPPVALTFSGTEGVYEGEAKTAFPAGVVNAFDPFRISWQASTDVNTPYTEMAMSANPLYVLHTKPIFVGRQFPLAQGTTQPHWTTIHLACTNAKGQSDVSEIVKFIYSEFEDRKVRKVDGRQDMGYWLGRNPVNTAADPACRTVSGFLRYEDATCGTWATFFNDMLLLNGIEGSKIGVVTVLGSTKLALTNSSLLIEDVFRDFSREDANRFTIYPYTGVIGNAIFYVKDWAITTDRSFSQCFNSQVGSLTLYKCNNDLDGLAAQGNPNPRAYFENHAVVVFGGLIYDPSYGSTPRPKQEWIEKSIDATGAIISIPNSPQTFHAWFKSRETDEIQID